MILTEQLTRHMQGDGKERINKMGIYLDSTILLIKSSQDKLSKIPWLGLKCEVITLFQYTL